MMKVICLVGSKTSADSYSYAQASVTWKVGTLLVSPEGGFEAPPLQVVSLEASGYELSFILTLFSNLPFCHGTCTWKDPWATFIYENLLLYTRK